jgi:hypothetical protein
MKTPFLSMALLSVALAAASGAHAATFGAGSSAGINALPSGDVKTYSTLDPAQLVATHTLNTASSGYGSTASGNVIATTGSATMHSFSSVVDPFANGCSNCGLLVAQQSDNAGFSDRIVLSSATLAVGTPVDLEVSMATQHSFSSSQALSLYLTAGFQSQFIVGGVSLYYNDPLQFPNVASGVLHTFIGQTIDLSAETILGTYAEYIDSTARSVTGDASAQFYIDPLEGGVTVSSDSGHDYATAAVAAVPEPSQLALLLAGFAAIGGVRQFRRNASESAREARGG